MTGQGDTTVISRTSKYVPESAACTANVLALAGLGFGVLANLVLRDGAPAGVGFSVWLLLLGTAVLWMLRARPTRQLAHAGAYVSVVVVASVFLVLRDSDWISAGLLLVIVTCAGMTYLLGSTGNILSTTVAQQLKSMLRVPYQAVLGFFPWLPKLKLYSGETSQRASGILRGLILVVPILIIFSALFASADIVVDRLIADLSANLSSNLTQFIFITIFFGWIAAGLLAGILVDTDMPSMNTNQAEAGSSRLHFKLGEEEVVTILGMVAVLFVAFVVLQATYLFGGQELIQRTTGLTVADYARRGFFELMWVAGLTLVMLLVVRSTCPGSRYFKSLAMLLVGCVMIMLVSASQRLAIYVDEFGLSVDRLLASAVMIWLAGSLLLFALLTVKNSIAGLATGISHTGMLMVLVLAVMNPAAYVTGINISRATDQGRALDIQYLIGLGADAVPMLIQNLDQLATQDACAARSGMLLRWGGDDARSRLRLDDWRSWNFSRAKAVDAVRLRRAEFQTLTADCYFLGR